MTFIIIAAVILLAIGIFVIIAYELDKRAQEKEKENQRRIREEAAIRIERQRGFDEQIQRYKENVQRNREEVKDFFDKRVNEVSQGTIRPTRPVRDTPRSRSASSVGGYTPTPYPATTYTGGYYDSGSSYGSSSSSSSSSSSCSSSSSSSYSSSDSGGGGFSGGCD